MAFAGRYRDEGSRVFVESSGRVLRNPGTGTSFQLKGLGFKGLGLSGLGLRV